MPICKLYQNGLTAGIAPSFPKNHGAIRGECAGWSVFSSRSNTRFLYSVRAADLPVSSDGSSLLALSLSFTIRDCPPSHFSWRTLREAFFLRLRRRGLYRLHWLTEWQRRGVPHLHCALWFDLVTVQVWMDKHYPGYPLEAFHVLIKADWLYLSAAYRSSVGAQDIKPITNDLGWLQYLSKHAARGAAHYQRAIGSHPVGWRKTGRMWGHLGDFPTNEPLPLNIENPAYYAFRRIVRCWRIANARCSSSPARIVSARNMLRCNELNRSRVRGVSEWIPLDLSLTIIEYLNDVGYQIDS